MKSHIQVAFVRAIRTYLVIVVPAFLALLGDEGPVTDLAAWKIAAYSGVPAALTFLWRAFYDPSPIPSLKDADQPAPDGE